MVAVSEGDIAAARERFFADETVESGVREQVLTSWQRCRSLGLSPERAPYVYHPDVDMDGRLVRAARPVLDQLESQLSGIKVSALLFDEKARILRRSGGEPEILRLLDDLPALPGFGCAEQIIGTNGTGTALVERRPALIRGREHFAESLRLLACAGAPIRDPISGRILGILDLTCLDRDADPAMLGLVTEAAVRIERRLFEQTSERERALLRAFLDATHRAGVVPVDLLPTHDRLRLLEKATELISIGHVGVAMVQLSGGRAATLRCRSVDDLAGGSGIAVEAVIDGSPAGHVASGEPRAGSPALIGRSAPAAVLKAATPTVCAPLAATEGWLLAVSEPGIGRLALQARERLGLLCEAGARIGTTLEVTRTAEELTEIAVPRFADYAAVDVPAWVPRGREPSAPDAGLFRIALAAVRPGSSLYGIGSLIHPLPSTPHARCLATGQPVLEPALETVFGWMAQDPERGQKVCEQGVHSLLAVPMQARGVTLGVVSFYRAQHTGPFEDDDVTLAAELVSRAAVCMDNARRYTREHTMSLELERAAESLKQSLESQRRFTTDASHELRTPLAGLRAQLEEAQLHPGETDLGELLDHALGDVDRLQALVTDLLLLAKIGVMPASALEHVDLARLAETETARRTGDSHPIRLDLRDGVMVDAVPIQIVRLLHNLLDNAHRHAASGVTVGVHRVGDRAELTVTDDGPGVPEAERDHIFERFARLDTARSRNQGGSGLGLAISRDIAHAHHGTLHVEEAPAHGARFVLRLPLS
ncbi:ATP-binding protein [Acrocarpospora sp. B8E8]|uniref:ATP-binding protein n=1 Tax=Acrocarpospora sp. B8E8 TaxID=3153572 RepID=UPI00325E00D4